MSGSFSANWQAVLASLEGQTGAKGSTTLTGSAIADQRSPVLAGVLGEQIGSPGSGMTAGKGGVQASTTGTPAPNALSDGSNAAFAQSAERLAQFQQFEALKASLISSAASTTESASSALSSRTNGQQHSHSTHASSTSDSSNAAIVPAETSAATSLQPATLMAGNNLQAAQPRARNNSPISNAVTRADANSSREAASDSDPASRAQSPAVSGAPARSNPLAVSGKELSAIAEPSSSAAGATGSSSAAVPATSALGEGRPNADGLNPLLTASASMDSASIAVSAGANQPTEVAAASDQRPDSKSNATSDRTARTARSTQSALHASSAESAAGPATRGTDPAPGNPGVAQSTIGSTTYPLAASASGPGAVPGSNLGSVSAPSSTATAASPSETFAALDGDAPGGSINWTHAGAHRAEAGFEDPALGWVGVRADLGGGSVHASLVPGSAEAAQMLGSHLAGLNDYLAERHPAVGPVIVAGHENGGSSTNAQSGSGNESGNQSPMQQGSTGNSDTGNSGSSNSNTLSLPNAGASARSNPISPAGEGTDRATASTSAFPAANLAVQPLGRSSGSHISVMA